MELITDRLVELFQCRKTFLNVTAFGETKLSML